MSTNKASYASAKTALTITLTSVLAAAARQSAEVDNSTLRYLDGGLEFSFTLAGAPAAGGYVELYLAASLDGSVWPDAVTGADAAITIAHTGNLIALGTVQCPAAGPNRAVWPTMMGPLAGLILPPWWSIVIVNQTDQTITAGSINFLGGQVTEE